MAARGGEKRRLRTIKAGAAHGASRNSLLQEDLGVKYSIVSVGNRRHNAAHDSGSPVATRGRPCTKSSTFTHECASVCEVLQCPLANTFRQLPQA